MEGQLKKNTKISNWDIVLPIAALWPIALSKPVLDVVGETPEYWTANRIDDLTIVAVAVVLSIISPAVLAGFLIFLRRIIRVRKVNMYLFGAVFIALSAIAVFHTLSLALGKPMFLAYASIATACIALTLFYRFDAIRFFFRIFAAASFLVPLSFLVFGPTFNLLKAPDTIESGFESRVELSAPLIVVIFDELSLPTLLNSNGEIDARLFPSFSRLAGMSTWFRNATVNFSSTERSLPSLLTGTFKSGELADTSYKQNPNNLFTLVHAPDGVLAAEPVTNLCPPEICEVLPKKRLEQARQVFGDFWLIYQNIMVPDRYASRIAPIPMRFQNLASEIPEKSVSEFEVNDFSKTGARLNKWFRERNESLVFLHFLLPHAPYIMNPDGSMYMTERSYKMIGWIPDQHAWDEGAQFYIAQAFQRHLLQTMYVDKVLGEILDSLESMGLLEESLLVVTADHGVAFKPGAKRRSDELSSAVIAENIAVPFFWKSPGQTTGSIQYRNCELVDFLPTLLEELGGPGNRTGLDGISLFSSEERPEKVFNGSKYPKDLWQEVLKARERLFGMISLEQNNDGTFFPRPAKYNALFGLQIANAPLEDTVAEVDNALIFSELNRVGKIQATFPNYVTGSLAANSDIDAVGIAINGLIRDVAEVYIGENGRPRFSSVFNPSVLKRGENALDFVGMRKTPTGQMSLSLLRPGGQSFRLDQDILVDSSGKPLRKDQERLAGVIKSIRGDIPGVVRIRGWMGDRHNWKPPIAFIILYKGGQQLSRPSGHRPDLARLGEEMTQSGFSTSIWLRGESFDPDQLRIFVILDAETYAEMKIRKGAQ